MSRKKHGNASLHSGPNMTPMVDIVMCILIFFMLGSTFTIPEMYLKSQTPAVDKGGLSTAKGDEKIPAVRNFVEVKKIGNEIVVTAFGKQYSVPAASDTGDADAQQAALAEQGAQLRNALASDLDAKKAELSNDVQIVIAPEGAVNWQAVTTVYAQLIHAQFAKIAFAPVKG